MGDNVRPWQGVLPQLGRRVYVDPAAAVIGQVTLGEDSSVWPMAVIRGDVNVIRVGARTSVQDGSVLHVTHDGPYCPGGFALAIGDEVTIGHRAVLHGCTVGDRCLIGMGSLVMDGAVVEDEVIVAAGAIVTPGTRCESHSLYVGAPARRARTLTDTEIGQLAYSAAWYVKVKDQYL
ncbi:MAG TPA: gamma carbonic anhydrase family protein [Pseudomonadales bacterium]|nr:gamma carbonic anhydrase family protein [Pseudomonadales bacterium]